MRIYSESWRRDRQVTGRVRGNRKRGLEGPEEEEKEEEEESGEGGMQVETVI